MNKIYKVMYSKVKQCAVVVSEIAKSHGHNGESSGVKKHAALTAAVLIALGSLSFTTVFVPMTAEAAITNTKTNGSNFVGVERPDVTFDTTDNDKKYENYNGAGAHGTNAITIGLKAVAADDTITIGDRNASESIASVYIGCGPNVPRGTAPMANLDTGKFVTSVGYNSDAKGYGSIAIGSNATATNSNSNGGITIQDSDGYPVANAPIQGASVALGYSASAADGALAMGSNAHATNMATALGYGARAEDNNIAIGANSVATAAASKDTARFRKATDGDYKAPSSYISVGSDTVKRRITNVAAGADENDVATVGQLEEVANNKVAWKLTTAGDNANASTVSAGDTVDFSAAKDSKENGQATGNDHSNLTISKENGTNNKVNMTVGLSNNVVLGQNVSGEGGSLDVYRAVGDASSDTETNEKNQSYDQLGSHVRIDGSTVSVHYDNGTDSDARGAVLGIANDSYKDTKDATKTVSSPLGYVYLQDGKNYYYLHGAMHGDTKYQGRLAYDSSESGYNYIANLDDGIKFSGDTKKDEKAVTVDTKLDSNAANNTLSITGGADVSDTTKLTNDNIGVVATTNETDSTTGEVKKAGGLSIQLAKDLTGITSISSQPTSATTTTGAKIELGTNGTTISGGNVNVSSNKITNLKNGEADTDAATVGQVDAKIKAANKYYSVQNGVELTGFKTNEDNLGASAIASMAAGYTTGTAGIASTVVGSYSGVIGSGLQGAAAVSVGTVNVNKNTGTSKKFSGVANSIVGQANMTTDSNAAIIVGAGNSVTNSYRELDKDALSAIQSAGSVSALKDALQAAVPKSGAQVMVMGGGNSVDKAYMTQVVGVGNQVTGSDDTYTEGTSTQYNYVDGFQNTLTNGKNDYIIGSNNSVTGDSINKNQSNIVVGDNHTLNNEKNNVIIGSSDTANDETTASDVVAIGHNAKVSAEGGVAIGSGSVSTATAEADAEGYDPVSTTTNKASTNTSATWKATTGAVSIGGVNGNTTTTRRITNLAAGFNDTDAVNVAQIKKLASVDASNIGKNFKDGDVTTNENAWGEALGTGTVTKDSKQLVTGSTVYNEVRPSKDGKYVKMSQTTGENLLNLDSQVQTNTDKLSDVDSRSVKYDTKTVNDKTVVDNSKITLAGEGGTTITNLKDGVNANDAATMGQLNDRISGVTYKAGDGIKYGTDADNNKTISVNKGDGLKFTEDHKLAVNTGKHLSVNTDGQIDVGDNGAVAENDGNLVTGDTVYKALNGGMTKMIIGTPGKNGKDGTPGTIGLVGPAGTNGKDGAVDITIQKGEDGKDGTKGANGVDGKDGINRIVYEDKNGKHQVATMEDGLKFAGDDGQNDATKAIAKKLNNTVDIIGGAKGDLTEGNIGVNSTTDGKLKVQLAKDLTDITSISNQKTEGDKTTGAKITLGDDGTTTISGGDVNVNGGKITNVGSGADASGNYTTTTNAANIGDVQKIVKDAVDSAADTTNKALAGKANIDASNIGANLKHADGSVASADDQKANAEKWGSAIGTGEIKADDGRMVTGKTVYDEVRPTEDGSYVKKNLTTGENLSALDSKIGKLDETKQYNYIDSGKDVSISNNLTKLDTQVKTNADAITNINQSISTLDQNAVKYDDSDKSKISLGGEGGTTITNVKAGSVKKDSTDAVNGGQLWQVDQKVDKNTTDINKNAGDITNLKNLSNITDAGKTVIKNLSKDAVQVKAGDRIKVDETTDDKGNKTYTISANNNGTVAKDDGNLISGGTLYNEVHVDKDGTYIKSKDSATGKDMTVAQNLSALDSGLKTTSDLIHTNTAGDTIQIGGSSTATKIDVSGKDKDGKSTGRIITGVVTDVADPTSAANVGYVNGVTAANTQQIYRDMNNAYGRLNNNINKAAAGSNALAALHPLDYDPDDKADFAVGYGHYRNANAAAVGAFYHPNENTMVNVGVSLGNGDPGFNAGVSFKVGRGGAGREAMSKTEMAKVINSQSKEIDALKKDNADKDKRIDALEQKMAEILAKLDKNGK